MALDPVQNHGGQAHRRRVLRGGAFNNNENNVRCAARNRNNPNNRNDNIGFRVCASTFFGRQDIAGTAWRS
ncbi:MAG: SUMF1/EgtB/PvdO family nonheme iron enzyme [Anaerolineae bacterium]|nr:SUMF1/EgtB/PvdO family nonheme iron enzyme [Anaerolineae bacterium]